MPGMLLCGAKSPVLVAVSGQKSLHDATPSRSRLGDPGDQFLRPLAPQCVNIILQVLNSATNACKQKYPPQNSTHSTHIHPCRLRTPLSFTNLQREPAFQVQTSGLGLEDPIVNRQLDSALEFNSSWRPRAS